jgi:surface antigen
MRAKVGWGLVWGAILVSCFATPTRRASAANCALYARARTGVFLYGAAGGWWDEAAGYYQRGHLPEVGSILVFKRTGYTPSGHVAIVSKVISANEILVDHANWYRGMISHDMPVIDTSPGHDWTTVAVMYPGSGNYGRDNPTYGFVYPETGPRQVVATADTNGFDPYIAAARVSYDEEPSRAGLFHFAIDNRYQRTRYHHRITAGRAGYRYSISLATAAHGHGRAGSRLHNTASRTADAPARPTKVRTSERKQHHRT